VLGSLNGYPAWVDIVYDPDEAYSTTLNTLRVNGLNATIAIQAPYSFEEPESGGPRFLRLRPGLLIITMCL
jgi:hypothetical protein